MKYIQGENRKQSVIFPETLDQIVDQDNDVRFIDLFVESIDIADFDFKTKTATTEGRPHVKKYPKTLVYCLIWGIFGNNLQFLDELELPASVKRHDTADIDEFKQRISKPS